MLSTVYLFLKECIMKECKCMRSMCSNMTVSLL